MTVTNFDIQPFSVLPGLNAYSEGLEVNAAREKKNKAEVAANLKQQQLMKAIQSGDPDQIFDFVSKNPGSSEYAGKMTNFVSDATKQSAVNSAIKVLTQGADPVQAMLEHSDVVVKEGGDASETLGITEAVMRDPTIARKQAELTLALHAPAQFKAYRDATNPSSKYTNIRPMLDGGVAGLNPASGAFERIPSGNIQFKDTTPNTNITLEAEGKGLSEEQKALARSRVKRFEALQTAADNAIDQNEQLAQMEALDVSTGFGTESLAVLGAAVNKTFGDGVGDALIGENVSALQGFKGVGARLVNTELNKATGPQTDGDAKRAASTLANLSNEADANTFLVNSLQAINARKVEQAQFYESYLERDGSLKGANKAWRDFKNQTPMLSGVVKNPQTGLPMFFNQFKGEIKRRQPELNDQQIIEAWRGLQ
jgi:hypothetical protein